jgi:hypothetical protein
MPLSSSSAVWLNEEALTEPAASRRRGAGPRESGRVRMESRVLAGDVVRQMVFNPIFS